MLTCAVAVEHLLLVPPLNSWSHFGVCITSNIVIYGLGILVSLAQCGNWRIIFLPPPTPHQISTVSPSHVLSTLAGIVGGLVAHKAPCLLPTRLTAALQLLGGGDFPTKVHSGATMEVQQQQQYDYIERLIQQQVRKMSMQISCTDM